jgi:hypothetical protein
MNRRRTLTLILAAALAGCGQNNATPNAPSAPTIQSDVSLISSGLSGIVAAIQATPGVSLPANVAAQAQAILADIQANAAGIAASLTPGQKPIDAIKTAVNTLANLLDPYLAKAPGASALVQSALALLPVILAMAGLSAAGTRRPTMAPEQARAVLRSRA